jgi:hypothetical protein
MRYSYLYLETLCFESQPEDVQFCCGENTNEGTHLYTLILQEIGSISVSDR